jgi:hypothetical protein
MKNIWTISIIAVSIVGCATASIKESQKGHSTQKVNMTVLDKGIKREISVDKSGITSRKSSNSNGVVVAFKNPSTVSIPEFESRYSLKLKSKLKIGYYIFTNQSNSSDMEIVSEIIASSKEVKTVKPNRRMHNKTR